FDPARFGTDVADARATITQLVAQLFAAYDMRVVSSRPTDEEPYVMLMVGGTAEDIGAPAAARGFAPLDCGDGNPWDVAFVFAATLALDFDLPVDARRAVAQVAAQEA